MDGYPGVPAGCPAGGADDPRCPAGLAAGLAFVGPLAICGLAGALPSVPPVAVEVTALAAWVAMLAWVARAAAAALSVGSAVLCLNAFRLNALGELAPHPRTDLPVLGALTAVWLAVWAARAAGLRIAASRSALAAVIGPAPADPGGGLAVPGVPRQRVVPHQETHGW
ncbi:hypothetical protein [Frankia sp. AgB32]|uniref:hypothetical protein n=1 Tax=Frankia sp. AgB32 TaxID=631119 RepID=UPI00200D35DD|nr:hypothetical protein [Frankia sp. AgB32]MCK9898282.1 hypothetical protein [Frankia sp. AgB32]